MGGFGVGGYQGEITLTDSQSGNQYAQWLQAASANPYVVGVEWFEYMDEPATGRGNNDGESNIAPSLVLGENAAFGMVDGADRPKYDLAFEFRDYLAGCALDGFCLVVEETGGADYLLEFCESGRGHCLWGGEAFE